MSIKDKIIELGGKGIAVGPTKLYASGFLTKEKAQEFIDWLQDNYKVNSLSRPIRMMSGKYDVGYDVIKI